MNIKRAWSRAAETVRRFIWGMSMLLIAYIPRSHFNQPYHSCVASLAWTALRHASNMNLTSSSKSSSQLRPRGYAWGCSRGRRSGRPCSRSCPCCCRPEGVSARCGTSQRVKAVISTGPGVVLGEPGSPFGSGLPCRCRARQGALAAEHQSGSQARAIDGLGWEQTFWRCAEVLAGAE
jgi:hypothetical protein